MHDAAEQQRQFRSLRTDVRMRLVKDDPSQLAARLIQDRSVFRAYQHVFQHRGVGNEQRCRGLPECPPRNLFGPGFHLLVGWHGFSGFAVVQAKPNVAAEAVAPGAQAVALTVDQRIQGIEEQRPDPGERAMVGPVPRQVL